MAYPGHDSDNITTLISQLLDNNRRAQVGHVMQQLTDHLEHAKLRSSLAGLVWFAVWLYQVALCRVNGSVRSVSSLPACVQQVCRVEG